LFARGVRPIGSQLELEHRRRLVVERILEGYASGDVADFFGVNRSSVSRWMTAYEQGGWEALQAHPIPGRPHRLTCTQEKIIARWLKEKPSDLGFATELWTAERLTQLIEQEFGVHFNAAYFSRWLHSHGLSIGSLVWCSIVGTGTPLF
jgi:transposase